MGKNKSRDDLITMVQRGEMIPADAESEVKRLGLGPLASEPDPNDYDPMREPFWTLPMTVAWIAYRSLNAVRACWDDYRKQCWDWHYREWRVGPDGVVHQGHFLEQMAFDSARKRSVLFGGEAGGVKNDTWEWDGGVWTQVADTGPTVRCAHRITFDSVRRRVVLFGGAALALKNDTWEWDGGVWTQVADTGPRPRSEHVMTFDSERKRVVLFGGYSYEPPSGYTWFNDTWEWDGAVWTQVADTGPSPRAGSAMTQMGTRTVLFGGYNATGTQADSWEWKDLRWTQRQNMGPPKRTLH